MKEFRLPNGAIAVELPPEAVKKYLEEIENGRTMIEKAMKKLNVPEDILDREIKPFGNASHIILPKEYSGKKAKVIIKK